MLDVSYSEEGFDETTDEDSCLFLSKYKLYRVTCPFQVTCLVDTQDFLTGEKVEVTRVVGWDERVLLYRVLKKLYPHSYFRYKPPHRLVITRLK